MPNIVNRLVVKELTEEFKEAEGMVVVTFGGLTVEETENIRGSLAEKGVKMRMVRNKLARLVLKERGVEFDEKALLGNTAIAYGDAEGAINAAKVFSDKEVKKAGKIKFKAGVLDGDVLDGASASQLADVPDRDTLNAQLLGVISGPARGLASIINAVPSSVARVIQAHADSGEEG